MKTTKLTIPAATKEILHTWLFLCIWDYVGLITFFGYSDTSFSYLDLVPMSIVIASGIMLLAFMTGIIGYGVKRFILRTKQKDVDKSVRTRRFLIPLILAASILSIVIRSISQHYAVTAGWFVTALLSFCLVATFVDCRNKFSSLLS